MASSRRPCFLLLLLLARRSPPDRLSADALATGRKLRYSLCMNHMSPPPKPLHYELRRVESTNAAEGLPRRRWTVKEIRAVAEAGIFSANERFELIGGELVPMNARGIFHERLKAWLNTELIRNLPAEVEVIPETSFYMSDDTFLEPDFLIYPKGQLEGCDGPKALLVIEVADSSRSYDLGRKTALYAAHGVRDFWVINARTLETVVHRSPVETGYRMVEPFSKETPLTPLLVEGYSIDLTAFEQE